jgi:hypothetical protein
MACTTGNNLAHHAMEPPHHCNSFVMAWPHRSLEAGDVMVLNKNIHHHISQAFPEPPLLLKERVSSTWILGHTEVVVEELNHFI